MTDTDAVRRSPGDADALQALVRRVRDDPTLAGVVGLTVVALVARLVGLGVRTAHFDEARVAYWTMQRVQRGFFEYRPVIHGPFIQHVDAALFGLLGPNDFTMRVAVALVGGLLPLVALLFRDRLRDGEVVAFALLLALNPVLLYYSRYMRSDVLVAAFMLAALGFLVRAYDHRSPRSLYAAAVFLAFGFASKENAAIYVVTWLGAAALLVDYALVRPEHHDSAADAVRARWDRHVVPVLAGDPGATGRARRYAVHGAGAVGVFLVVFGFFFAPRAGSVAEVGVWRSLTNPGMIPDVLRATYVESVLDAGRHWVGGSTDVGCGKQTLVGGYRCFAGHYVMVLTNGAGALLALAAGGFLLERYWTPDARPLVVGAGYWGIASVVGYPLGADIRAAWLTVHAIVPLAIPAAVALALVARWAREALADSDGVSLALSVLLVAVVVGSMGATGVQTSFQDPQSHENFLVQFAQPADQYRPALRDAQAVMAGNDGTDVLYYGPRYDVFNESRVDHPPRGAPGGWFNRLPLPWYFETYGAEIDSVDNESALERALADDPPVLVVQETYRTDVDDRLEGYSARTVDLRRGPNSRLVVIYVDESRLDGGGGG